MFKGTLWVVALATSIAVPCAIAQQTGTTKGPNAEIGPDQQVKTMTPPKKMTEEEKKADIAAKRASGKQTGTTKGPNAEIGKDQQVKTMTPPKKMTEEEKKADKAAKRIAPTPEEQAKQAKQVPGG